MDDETIDVLLGMDRPKRQENECPACGGFKLYGEFCDDCAKFKRDRDEAIRRQRRMRFFDWNPFT